MVILPTEKRFNWNNPPFVLCTLILINIITFFFYQSGDDEKYSRSIQMYQDAGLLKKEWNSYVSYLKTSKDNALLSDVQDAYQQKQIDNVIYYILRDKQFSEYLAKKARAIYGEDDFEDLLLQHQKAASVLNSTSALRFGLKPNDIGIVNLVSHQFMHGGFMHLMGNLFFLVICGFAVETAIGHWRFLLFYLLSGALGGISYALIDLKSPGPLIGASGAISGVMAMYLWVFRLKSIEFFYWFYVFVGYVRLPALLVLPLYISQELVHFFLEKDAHVAFMAHFGGFVSASIMMGILLLWKPHTLDEEYIAEDHTIDPNQQKLAEVYKAIETFQFPLAEKKLMAITTEHEETFALSLLRYQLIKMRSDEEIIAHVKNLLAYKKLNAAELYRQEKVWLEKEHALEEMSDDDLIKMGMRFSAIDNMATAEKIFSRLQQRQSRNEMMGVYARKLSVNFQKLMNNQKTHYYADLAEAFMSEGKL